MDEYREAQKKKWLEAQKEKQAAGEAATAGDIQAPAAATSSGSAAATAPAARPAAPTPAPEAEPVRTDAASEAASSGPQNTRRLHILPVGADPTGRADERRRLELLAPELRRKRDAKEKVRTGTIIRSNGLDFIVVKSDPEESFLYADTDYYVDGEPIQRFEKVQFICLWDFESGPNRVENAVLFTDYVFPHFRRAREHAQDGASIVNVGEIFKIRDLEFQVMAAEPSREIGIVDQNTMVYVDWDGTPAFEKIHIVPFQDTLPHAYEFDVFNDYIKPYLKRNRHKIFTANDQFTFQGVQFKVVCCEPAEAARVGRNTTIYCEGVLHPSLRNLLPPELLEQLSNLPPGLQMLLLNTEALAGGYEDRLIEVQEMLSRRRGLNPETIDRIERFRWDQDSGSQEQTQCMVCLCDFVPNEEVRRLPCNHVFHASCIDEWLRRCTDCPICKANVDRAVRR